MLSAPPASRRNKLILSFSFIIVSVVYALWQRSNAAFLIASSPRESASQSYKTANEALLQTLSQITITSVPSSEAQTAPIQPTMPAMMQKRMGRYIDGSYTGTVVDAYYGTVQVRAVIQNGRISDVVFLQHPDNQSNSRYINGQAMPLLTQEAISAQNAQVNGVSGATFTSQAFQESLAAALVKAA